MPAQNPSERAESEHERLNRQLDQLLDELRVATLLIAPPAFHRLVFQARDEPLHVGLWFVPGILRRLRNERSH